jgi:hypothetical protein
MHRLLTHSKQDNGLAGRLPLPQPARQRRPCWTRSSNAPTSLSRAQFQSYLLDDGDLLAISMGPLQSVPKIVGIPVPCCDPSVVELQIRRSLGPVQTLLRQFEFKHWGATITLTGFNLSQPGRIRVRYRRRRRLQKYVCGTTCT